LVSGGLSQIDIVGDQKHGALEIIQRIDQGFAAINIKVRGWLVEDKNMWFFLSHKAEQQADFFSA